MPILSYIHFACLLAYLALAGLLVSRHRRDPKALWAAALLLALAVWSLGHMVTYSPFVQQTTAERFGGVSSVGWIAFGPLWVLFALTFAQRHDLLRTLWVHAVLWLPAAVFLDAQRRGLLFAGYQKYAFGWDGAWQATLFTYAYFTYYMAATAAGVYVVHRYGRQSESPDTRRSARLMAWAALLVLLLGTTTNVIARLSLQVRIPPIANILSLAWAIALFLAVVRHRLFELTQRAAELHRANDQLSHEVALRRETESKLRESEERFRVMFECAPDGWYLCDFTGAFVDGNRQAEAITGYQRSELMGSSFLRLSLLSAVDLPRAGRLLALNAMGRPTGPDEFRLRRKDGSRVDVEILTYPVHVGGRSLVLGIARDITARRKAQRDREQFDLQRQQNEKLDALGQLAGGVAHDFNNMLGAIMGNAQLLMSELPDSPPHLKKFVGRILEASRHSADLTTKLLTFSRRGTSGLTLLNLNRTVEDVVGLLKHTIDRRIAVVTELVESEPVVKGDTAQLANLVMNLALNARDAMPEGGTLRIATGREELQEPVDLGNGRQMPAGSYVRLVVSDTGSGMGPEVLQHLFDPFFTTKSVGKGTGLGLSSVYGTVESHGGKVSVESEPGKGTAFTVLLPAAKAASAGTGSAERRSELPRGSGTVLVVDNEYLVREMSRDMLLAMGYQPVLCSAGSEALEYLRAGKPADIVVLDMNMPEMNGRACFEQIREFLPHLPVVVATGYAVDEDVQTMAAQGVPVVRKPFEAAKLAAGLSESLRSAGSTVKNAGEST